MPVALSKNQTKLSDRDAIEVALVGAVYVIRIAIVSGLLPDQFTKQPVPGISWYVFVCILSSSAK